MHSTTSPGPYRVALMGGELTDDMTAYHTLRRRYDSKVEFVMLEQSPGRLLADIAYSTEILSNPVQTGI